MSLIVGYVPDVHFAACLMSRSNILTICTQCVQPEKKENVRQYGKTGEKYHVRRDFVDK